MKLKSLFAGLLVATLVPAAALAQTPPAPVDKANAVRECKALLASLGEDTFKATYGTNANKANAMGKCVSAKSRAEHQNRRDAAAACTLEQQDSGFAATHGNKTFVEYYGKGKKGTNALQQCIRSKHKAARTEDRADTVNAARKCKAERVSIGETAFAVAYGTNAGNSNAFGKCVAKLSSD